MTRRDWSAAQFKRDQGCRVCGKHPVELAHVIGRANDKRYGNVFKVHPDSVAPLCHDHHTAYDARRFDLLPYLSVGEQAQAVIDARGIVAALRRISGRLGFSDENKDIVA